MDIKKILDTDNLKNEIITKEDKSLDERYREIYDILHEKKISGKNFSEALTQIKNFGKSLNIKSEVNLSIHKEKITRRLAEYVDTDIEALAVLRDVKLDLFKIKLRKLKEKFGIIVDTDEEGLDYNAFEKYSDEKKKILQGIENAIMSFNNDLIKMGENKIIPPDKLSINFFSLDDKEKPDNTEDDKIVVSVNTIDVVEEEDADITHLL